MKCISSDNSDSERTTRPCGQRVCCRKGSRCWKEETITATDKKENIGQQSESTEPLREITRWVSDAISSIECTTAVSSAASANISGSAATKKRNHFALLVARDCPYFSAHQQPGTTKDGSTRSVPRGPNRQCRGSPAHSSIRSRPELARWVKTRTLRCTLHVRMVTWTQSERFCSSKRMSKPGTSVERHLCTRLLPRVTRKSCKRCCKSVRLWIAEAIKMRC